MPFAGHKAAQFVDLLGYFTVKSPDIMNKVTLSYCQISASCRSNIALQYNTVNHKSTKSNSIEYFAFKHCAMSCYSMHYRAMQCNAILHHEIPYN